MLTSFSRQRAIALNPGCELVQTFDRFSSRGCNYYYFYSFLLSALSMLYSYFKTPIFPNKITFLLFAKNFLQFCSRCFTIWELIIYFLFIHYYLSNFSNFYERKKKDPLHWNLPAIFYSTVWILIKNFCDEIK